MLRTLETKKIICVTIPFMNEVNIKRGNETADENKKLPKKYSKLIRILSTVALLVFLLGGISVWVYKNPSYFVVAKVGDSFITRKKLNDYLFQSYGKSVLDQLVTEEIILQAVKDSEVKVSQEEIKSKTEEIAEQIKKNAGMDLSTFLKSQHMSKSWFERNIYMQLGLEKLLAPELKVSKEDVDKFMEENSEYLTGTDEEKRKQASDAVVSQKFNSVFQSWLEDKKSKTSVSSFLE